MAVVGGWGRMGGVSPIHRAQESAPEIIRFWEPNKRYFPIPFETHTVA